MKKKITIPKPNKVMPNGQKFYKVNKLEEMFGESVSLGAYGIFVGDSKYA